jgi:[ribosomal protein S5]-alanine N-acetyltransferase
MPRFLSLETKRLTLRDFLASDWKAVQEYANDLKVVRFMPWGPNTMVQTRAFIRKVREWAHQKPRRKFEFAVILRSENRLIGGCGIRIINPQQREADMGYAFHQAYWGKGYATEASRALIKLGFSKLKLHRILATCDRQNKASSRVLEKAGMKREGLLQQNIRQRGRWRDTYLYAILEKERNKRH